MPSLRLTRIAWVLLPVVAVGLAVLAWRQGEIDSEAEAERAVQRSTAAMVRLQGSTGAGDQASVTLDHGRYGFLTAIVRFRCTHAVNNLWAIYDAERLDRSTDRDASGVLRLRHRGIKPWLPHRWQGVSDLTVDARYDRRHFTGTLSARLRLNAHGVHATCRSGRVRLKLPSSVAPDGRTFG